MDPREESVLPNAHGRSNMAAPPPATVRRRLSVDEDLFYQRIMTGQPPRPSHPPPYQVEDPKLHNAGKGDDADQKSKSKGKGTGTLPAAQTDDHINMSQIREALPGYQSTIELEGIFMKKHEIEDTTKRAEDRRWHTTYVTLTGTALNLYTVKKNRTWGKTKDGPTISPDNPPWMRKAKLEKSYSLLYADAGIAADYKKRRYVIRVRAETDQFLLSCIELSTFNTWLEGLFAAIDVALPIEDRDFPRDMSIPRVQRVRWYRGIPGAHGGIATTEPLQAEMQAESETEEPSAQEPGEPDDEDPDSRPLRRRSSSPDPLPTLYQHDAQARPPTAGHATAQANNGAAGPALDGNDDEPTATGPRLEPAPRMSTSSYPNDEIDPHSGKWVPDHRWTSAHDLLYAKLCYSNLLFRSPRKSNFIIRQGKKWYVDWATGRQVRVLPPAYGEVDWFGPWQIIHTENMRI